MTRVVLIAHELTSVVSWLAPGHVGCGGGGGLLMGPTEHD
jgi:hypothetical protein